MNKKHKEDKKMAKYEELGYCPNNAFGWCEHKTDAGKRALEILGDRIGYMVYETDSVSYKHRGICGFSNS